MVDQSHLRGTNLIINSWEGTFFVLRFKMASTSDGDPRASFAVLEYTAHNAESSFTLHRIEYDIEKAKKETHRVGLPAGLAERLEDGL